MIEILPGLSLDDDELTFEASRSSGPGGQNVNKVATAVTLRFDAAGSPSLPEPVRERLLRLAGGRATRDGVIVLRARRHRSQARNRRDVLDRLVELIREAAEEPEERKATKPTKAARRRRVDDKRRRGEVKQRRKRPDPSES
jgi:ribosome-associated protein